MEGLRTASRRAIHMDRGGSTVPFCTSGTSDRTRTGGCSGMREGRHLEGVLDLGGEGAHGEEELGDVVGVERGRLRGQP